MSVDKNNEKLIIVIKCITGNVFQLEVDPIWTVEDLKDIVSKKLDIPVDNFSILSKYRELTSGTLASNEIIDGSEIIVITAVQSGWKEFKRVDDSIEVLNTVSDKEIKDFFCQNTFLCFDARIGDEVLNFRLKFDRLKPPAISDRKPRKRKRKCCLPKKLKSPKTRNSDKVSVTKAMNGLKKTIQSIFNFHIPEGSIINVALKPQITVTECDGSSRRSDSGDGDGDNKVELLTIINILNEMLSGRLASTLTTCDRSNDSLKSREEAEQKLKTQRTMEKILEKLRKRKLRKQRPKTK